MLNSPRPLLDFKVQPAFAPRVSMRLMSMPSVSGRPEYALACAVMPNSRDLGVSEAEVPPGTAETLLADFWSLSLNPEADRVAGLDGTTYSLRLVSDSEIREVSWWSCYPDGWEVLDPLLRRLIDLAGPEVRRHVLLGQRLMR